MLKKCFKCNQDSDLYCFNESGQPVCNNCIKTYYEKSLFCLSCGMYLGEIGYPAVNVKPSFYVNVSSIGGKGIGTYIFCYNCTKIMPDRLKLYNSKIDYAAERMYITNGIN